VYVSLFSVSRLPVLFGYIILVVAVLGALGAHVLAPYGANDQELAKALLPPAWLTGGSPEHLLGTDVLGRDLFSRILYGARDTLLISTTAVVLSGILGISLGLISGYGGGMTDEIIMRLVDVQLSIPILLLAITVIAVMNVSIRSLVLAVGLSAWVTYARIIRSQALSLKEHEFIEAARASGAGELRIVFRHVLSNVANSCLVLGTLEIANMIILTTALSFLGLGVRPPEVDWGSIVGDGRDYITTAWWIVTFPGLAISLVILSVNLVGDELRDRLDPELPS